MIKKTALGIFITAILLYVSLILYIQTHAHTDTAKPSNVIIVLGTRPNLHSPNPCLIARVTHAVSLQRKGLAPTLLFSGGKLGIDDFSEAEVMATVAAEMGLPKETMLLEPRSISTYENLIFSSTIAREKKLTSAIIVSDQYHLPRAALIAQKIGMTYSLSPAINSPCTTELHNRLLFFLMEPIKIVYYKLTGKI